jgi:hypothetical protein
MAKGARGEAVSYWLLNRSDLKGFDDVQIQLVMDYMAAGWTGRISQRGHAILHAPAPSTATASVPRDGSSTRNAANGRATLDRWLKANPPSRKPELKLVPRATEDIGPATAAALELAGLPCPYCTRRFATKKQLVGHKKAHTLEKAICSECGGEYASKGFLAKHVRETHRRRRHQRIRELGDRVLELQNELVEATLAHAVEIERLMFEINEERADAVRGVRKGVHGRKGSGEPREKP